MNKPNRSQLREYIKHALNEMVRAETDGDVERIVTSARNIEHLATQLREHAEQFGMFQTSSS